MTNAEARAIARDLHRLALTRGKYGSDRDRAVIECIDGQWVVSIWEPGYAAMWTVFVSDNGAPQRAVRNVR